MSVILRTPEAYWLLGLVGYLKDANYDDKRVGRVQEVERGKHPPATSSWESKWRGYFNLRFLFNATGQLQ